MGHASSRAEDLTLDADGNIYIAGDGSNPTADQQYEEKLITAKFDSNGQQLWEHTAGESAESRP